MIWDAVERAGPATAGQPKDATVVGFVDLS
ncbi:MAG: hypothetical protein QOI12_5237 [Alphaproteobacteria bacterium]|jgi:hypothetical protein|nr:hypothetical protein [Alphaproteobacteria bacterium]